MAPNKKKKKPASNPARGFATTSIASKPKNTDLAIVPDADSSTTQLTDVETLTDVVRDTELVEDPKDIHQLSPEEFEKQLEESELQNLVEKYASKCKRESTRQVTRLQTERRVLRGQTERLKLTHWLPPEALEEIADLIRREEVNGALRSDPEHTVKSKPPNEEESSARLWTLQQALLALGMSEDRVREVLQYLLDRPPSPVLSSKAASKDTIWGLEEALDWLALICKQKELPDYDIRRKIMLAKAAESPNLGSRAGKTDPYNRSTQCADFMNLSPCWIIMNLHGTDSLQNTPQPSGTTTPLTELSLNSERPEVGGTSAESFSSQGPHDELTESEEELEPDDLLPTWLSVKSSLYELSPDLATGELMSGRRPKGKKSKTFRDGKPQSPKIAKLVRRLAKIEKDVFFDQYVAERQWVDLRISLAQELAQRKRLQVDARGPDSSAEESNRDEDAVTVPGSRSEDEDDLLGQFFESLPESSTDANTGVTTMVGGDDITIRDFGKWTGMSPRRVLEEACRARYVSL